MVWMVFRLARLLYYYFIPMEKLIELLNEYEWQDSWSYDEKLNRPYIWWGDDLDYECYIISKKYWFIKWLVENDKIEICPISKDYRIQIDLFGDWATYWELWWEYRILMLLSIQDNPIGFLCSILK